MRNDTEIEHEIQALRKALRDQTRWNEQAREAITHTIDVLKRRMSADDIEREYYVDETMTDYHEDDNDLYNELMLVHHWMVASKGYSSPSTRL